MAGGMHRKEARAAPQHPPVHPQESGRRLGSGCEGRVWYVPGREGSLKKA